MSTLAGRYGRNLLLYGSALLIVVITGAIVAYSQRFLGDSSPYVLVGGLLAISIAGAILWQWRFGVLMLVAALPFESILTSGAVASGIKLLALLTFAPFALALLIDQKLFERFVRLWQQPLALAVLAFMLWLSASILWAFDKHAVLSTIVTYWGVFGLMVVVAMLERKYLMLTWIVFVCSAALSVPAGYIIPAPAGSDMAVSGRFGPAGAGPDSYSCLLAIAFFAAFFGLLRHHRLVAYLLAPVFLYGIVATQSRTGLVVIIATPILAAFLPRLIPRLGLSTLLMYYVLGVAAIALVFLVIPSVGGAAAERYTSLSQIGSESTWNGRWSIWQAAFQIIASHPFLGVGLGNFAQFAVDQSTWVASHSAKMGEVAGVTHNVVLGVTSELGTIGLVLLLGILFYTFKTALPIAWRSGLGTGIILGLVVSMIASMTLEWEYQKILYVLFGSVLALQLHRDQHAALPNERKDTS